MSVKTPKSITQKGGTNHPIFSKMSIYYTIGTRNYKKCSFLQACPNFSLKFINKITRIKVANIF